MEQTIYIGGITEFTIIEIKAMLNTINIDGEIFPVRHMVDNGPNFREIFGHWNYFHGVGEFTLL